MLTNTKKFNLVVLVFLLVQFWGLLIGTADSFRWGQNDVYSIATDLGEYYLKVKPVLRGIISFSHMQLEYPIMAFPLMAIPALFASNMDHYLTPFMLEMMIWNAALFFMVVRWVRRERDQRAAIQAAAWYTLWMLLFTPTWALRIDVPAATLIFASFTWLISRPGLAAAIGVLGGYIKLVPLVTVLAASRQRRSIKTSLIAGGIFIFILVVWWVAAGTNMEYAIRYHLQRGIEIGSLYSGIFFIIGKIASWSMMTEHRFASAELITPVSQQLLRFIPIIQVAAILYPLFRLKAGTNARNLRLVIAMVLGYILFGKVLSPQYLIWLIPLFAVLSGAQARKQKLIFTAACLGTMIIYPLWFTKLTELHPSMFVVLNLRNGLLVWLYWISIRSEKVDSLVPIIVSSGLPSKKTSPLPGTNQSPNSRGILTRLPTVLVTKKVSD